MVVRDTARVRSPGWVILALLIAAGGASHRAASRDSPDPRRVLIGAMSLAGRDFAPRLSGGFPWAPLRGGDDGSADLSARAAEAELRQTRDIRSFGVRHALALCDLLRGNPHAAARTIEALTGERSDAAAWNDLAAAQLVGAVRDDDPSRLARALVAVDAALEAAPAFPEARFNRALILETLGLRDQARQDWQSYLALDGGSAWAVEARQHLQALPAEESFDDHFARRYTHLLTDGAEARALARRWPQESRIAGEEEILANWGAAVLAGDAAGASKHLGLARSIGDELLHNGGDGLLPAMVDSIEHADEARRTALAQAHVHFREGRQLYRNRALKESEQTLGTAADEFARGNSAGALMARAFTAGTIFEESRVADAGEHLEPILAALDPRYPALRAEVLWVLGGVSLTGGRWGSCLERLAESAALFERLRESNYAAKMHDVLAYVYARIGEPEKAWRHRLIALRELGGTPSFRLHQAFDGIAQAAMADDDCPLALSFLGLDIELAKRLDNVQATIESHLDRAALKIRQQQRAAAEIDVRETRRLIDRLRDPTDRQYFDANTKALEASLTTNPATAIALLNDPIEFHSTLGWRMHLPWLFMLRGRANRSLGDPVRAAADFEAGIRELETHRTSLTGEDRWGIFHAAEDLFGDAIALALDQGEPQRAFAYAERERARGLLDTMSASWRPVTPADIPDGTVVVEYAFHENTLFVFTIGRSGVNAARQRVTRETLRRELASLNEALASADGTRMLESGRALHRRLLDPVEHEIAGAKRIAFVPDPRLGNLPFAALRDESGAFLVERCALTSEPSAAVFTRLHAPSRTTLAHTLLVVSGAEDLGVLAFAGREARAVATQYADVRRLARERATAAAFAREAAAADVIHFVGHSVASSGALDPGYLLLKGGDAGDGRLDVKRIAALRLPQTSLVVLAACATAAGEIRSTEGTISVARAFLAAGVPSVVATLSPIADEDAADFFPRFHQNLVRGASPAEALRQTQLEWIGRGDRSAAMWTAVQVIGQ